MLRQARPKSQPALKYTPVSSQKKPLQPQETIVEQIEQAEQLDNNNNINTKTVSLSNLCSDSSSSSSSSSSSVSSSSSSLASSSISLTTNSSTSTVLATGVCFSSDRIPTSNKTTSQLVNTSSLASTKKNDASSSSSSSSSSDEEELLHSSSSSTSSSSGLSSMNSKSSIANQTGLVEAAASDCVRDLVESVAKKAEKEEATYSSFKLDEVVLTQTTTSSGSSDEECSKSIANEHRLLSNVNGKIHLVRELEINSELQSNAFILHSARRYIGSVLAQRRKSQQQQQQSSCWFVSILAKEFAIEWIESTRLDQSERLEFNQIIDCLIEDQLLVWVIERNSKEKRNLKELETTLDDIAEALDEPIDGNQSSVSAGFNKKLDKLEAYGVETLIWLCSSDEEARSFFDCFQAMRIAQESSLKSTFNQQALISQTNDPSKLTSSSSLTLSSALSGEYLLDKQVKQAELEYKEDVLRKQSKKVSQQSDDRLSSSKAMETPVSVANEVDSLLNELQQTPRREAETKQTSSIVPANSSSQKETTSQANSKTTTSSLRKSTSGLDLSQSSSLASYYRNVANKVISNGQSKIKSLKDEMIKLNSRTSASSAKRLSMSIPKSPLSPASSTRNLTSNNNNKSTETQLASSSVVAKTLSSSSTSRTTARQQQVPEIKPRTSILKNKNQATTTTTTTCDKTDNNSCQQNKLDEIQKPRASSTQVKPKSILKSSKLSSDLLPTKTAKELTRNSPSPGFERPRSNSNLRSMRRIQPTTQTSSSTLKTTKLLDYKRRSCAPLTQVEVIKSDASFDKSKLNEEVDDFEAEEREQTFERLRMRASCYDISRLMSKNGLQSQLNKLRSGSTSSIAAKSRQRRPALLIDSNNDEEPDKLSMQINKSNESGLVRAEVTNEHLQQVQQSKENSTQTPTDESFGKRSEFDPRSLRRIPTNKLTVRQETDAEVGKVDKVERRKSVTMIKLINNNNNNNNNKNLKDKVTLEDSKDTKVEYDGRGTVVCVGSRSEREKEKEDEKKLHYEKKVEESKSDEDDCDDDGSSTEVEDEESDQLNQTAATLSRSGPFSLLRQSFSQKSLSSMLKFSSRASLRVKAPSSTATSQTNAATQLNSIAPTATSSLAQSMNQPNGSSTVNKLNKATAIAVAEANLLAAKQLKQQAQKLKEQQKRELQQQQQQQAALMDTSSMLLAFKYNQQLQRQQVQQQQHQLLYQQYAIAARGQMFDPSSMHLQHAQMMIQRQQQQQQQQQQMAYMASLNSQAHYMAQQMAAASVMQHSQPATIMTTHHHHQQQLMYSTSPAGPQMQPPQMPIVATTPTLASHSSGGLFRKSILKSSRKAPDMIPMAVNHHSSSFNIVYNAPVPTTTTIPSQESSQQTQTPTKHSSLGASMRKTVKSILVNRTFSTSNSSANLSSSNLQTKQADQHEKPPVKVLKSALKSSKNRPIILNSEGSDSNDGSSSDSTTTATNSTDNNNNNNNNSQMLPKSVLKTIHRTDHEESSDSSNETDESYPISRHHKSSTLTRVSANELRARMKTNNLHASNPNYATLRASKRKSLGSTSSTVNSSTNGTNTTTSNRKNVTFSAKLTSIL